MSFSLQLIGEQAPLSDAIIYSVLSILACGSSLGMATGVIIYIWKKRRQGKKFPNIRDNQLAANIFHLIFSIISDAGFFTQHVYRLINPNLLGVCNITCVVLGFVPLICMAQVPWIAYLNYIAVTNATVTLEVPPVTVTQVLYRFALAVVIYTASLIVVFISSNTVTSYRGMYWASCLLDTITVWGYIAIPVAASMCSLLSSYMKAFTAYRLADFENGNNIASQRIKKSIFEHGVAPAGIFGVTWLPMFLDFLLIANGVSTPYNYSFLTALLAKLQTLLLSVHLFYVCSSNDKTSFRGNFLLSSSHRSVAPEPSSVELNRNVNEKG